LSGNELVSNRNNASNTWKLPNAHRRPAVKNTPVVLTATEPLGGYDPDAVRISPSSPLTTSGTVTVTGAAAATGPTAADDAAPDPAEFDAVTTTCTNEPTSPDTGVYDAPVAPTIGDHGPDPDPDDSH
jgi:hypothetical protein